MNFQPYIIGETAYHHEGDFNFLLKLIDTISEIGLNAVKFHIMLDAESYMTYYHPAIQEVKKWLFTEKQWIDIINYSRKKNLEIIMLCNDVESIEFLIENKFPVHGIELHSTGLNDYFLLNNLINFSGKIYLGIGGSTIDEIQYAVDFLKRKKKNDIILMYGFQNYPTDYSKINLYKIYKYKELFGLPVGYADHTDPNDKYHEIISILAMAQGFNILEKHVTHVFGEKRIDYQAACNAKQLIKIKEMAQMICQVFGKEILSMSDEEANYGKLGIMKKAIVAKKPIKKGEKLTLEKLWFKRTNISSYIKQNQLFDLIGLKVLQDIEQDEIINFTKVQFINNEPDNKKFILPNKK